jgi:hypothetical protein
MTEDLLALSIHDLWGAAEAEFARDFLSLRKLSDAGLLGDLGVGFINGYITFAQRDLDGLIQERYRGYKVDGHVKWQWFGSGTGGPGIWLAHRPALDRVLFLEGEWDVLTAMVRLRLHTEGWNVATWTAGASSSPTIHDIPKGWHGKEVHICYDNDVWQGTDYSNYICKEGSGAINKTKALLRNLLERVCPVFRKANCPVFIRTVPIPPKEKLGADFRDWVDGGGKSLDGLPKLSFELVPPIREPEPYVKFDELWDSVMMGQRLSTRMAVSGIGGDDLVIPTQMRLRCQFNQLSSCSSCLAPRIVVDQIVDLTEYQEDVTLGLVNEDLQGHLLRHVLKRPRSCPEAQLSMVAGVPGSNWLGVRPGATDDTRQRACRVISHQAPSLSGEVGVTGVVHTSEDGKLIIHADKVTQFDKAEIDLSNVHLELQSMCPHWAKEVEDIDKYLDDRWRDISCNVTKVFGRRDVFVAVDLLFHSVTDFTIGGKMRRGWLDISLIGDTRTGKSQTLRGFSDWLGLGAVHSAVDNISRAGLIMGSDRQGMLRPGLMTKSHRKLLALDEFHWMVPNRRLGEDHPMSWLQSARDEGKVFGIKIYGDRVLPAKVRLATISNWANSRRRTFAYPCQHLLWLYGSPETLSRLDFGVTVEGPPSQDSLDEVPQQWTSTLAKSLVLRAWAQDAGQVKIDDNAIDLAFELAGLWSEMYAYDRLPLYTPEEKPYSILRIATAVANICFSSFDGDVYSVHVKEVHVRWAAEWLKKVWHTSQYDTFSRILEVKDEQETPFTLERFFLVSLGLSIPAEAIRILTSLQEPFSPRDMDNLGIPPDQRSVLMGRAMRANVFQRSDSGNGLIELAAPAYEVVNRLIELATSDPDAFAERFNRLSNWTEKSGKMIPLTGYGS